MEALTQTEGMGETEHQAKAGTPDTMDTFFAKLDDLNAITKWFNKQGKALIRKNTKAKRRSTQTKSGFAVPVVVDTKLAQFLNIDPNVNIPRTEVTKMITRYVKENDLQCENKKLFKCDKHLAAVFGVDENYVTNWFEMQKFLAKLLTSSNTKTPENNLEATEVSEATAESSSNQTHAPKKIKKSRPTA